MSYGPHHQDRAWQQEEPADRPDNGDVNDLIDTPTNEDGRLHQFVEDLLTGPEPYENGPYTGDDNSDPGFYSDSDFDDDAPY